MSPGPGVELAGVGLLLRAHLRRDRVLLAAWIVLLAVMAYASAAATSSLFASTADRVQVATVLNDQAGLVALYGPILDVDNAGELAMSKLTVLYALLSGALYVVVVRRHTRTEEESGRAELVGGTVVGRDAALLAATAEAAGVAVVLGTAVAVAAAAGGLPAAGAAWFGVSWVGTGVVCAGVAAVCCQLSASTRTCAALSAAALAGTYLVRAVGDTVPGWGWLSWLSPLGWNTRLRAWSDPRWWLPVLYAVLAAALLALAWVLGRRRDLGAGLLSTRRGATSGRLSSPWALTRRLHLVSLVTWSVVVAALGGLFGAMAPGFDDLLATGGARELVERLGGAFVAALLPVLAMVTGVFGISVVARAQHDEDDGRLALLLAAGATRWRWFAATTAASLLGATWLMVLAGLGLWCGFTLAGGDLTPGVVGAAAGWGAATGVVVAVALLGLSLRAAWLGWAALLAAAATTLVGELLELPGWVVGLSPYSALSAYPAEPWTWRPVLALAAVVVVVLAAAGRTFTARDVA